MKKVWARIGISMQIADELYDALKEQSVDEYGRYGDVELNEDTANLFFARGTVDGDSYIPASSFEDGSIEFFH